MPKAYITAPYTEKSVIKAKSHVYGEIKDMSYRHFLDVIESTIRECGFSTFLPHRDIHQWGEVYIEPEIVMKRVMEALQECDLIVAYPEHAKGPNVELGMAITLNKKAIIILNESEKLSLVHAGLNSLTPTKIIRFSDIMDMKDKLKKTLLEFAQK